MSSAIRDLHKRDAPPPAAFEALIAVAPGSVSDPVEVTIPNFDEKLRFGPCRWMPRGEDLPTRGDAALAIRSDDGEWWVIAWWPYT